MLGVGLGGGGTEDAECTCVGGRASSDSDFSIWRASRVAEAEDAREGLAGLSSEPRGTTATWNSSASEANPSAPTPTT